MVAVEVEHLKLHSYSCSGNPKSALNVNQATTEIFDGHPFQLRPTFLSLGHTYTLQFNVQVVPAKLQYNVAKPPCPIDAVSAFQSSSKSVNSDG